MLENVSYCALPVWWAVNWLRGLVLLTWKPVCCPLPTGAGVEARSSQLAYLDALSATTPKLQGYC